MLYNYITMHDAKNIVFVPTTLWARGGYVVWGTVLQPGR